MFLSRIIGHTVFYLEGYGENAGKWKAHKSIGFCETYKCGSCGREHDKVWYYKPAKSRPFGNFMAVRVGHDWHVPDSSLPCNVERIPRNAIPLSEAVMSKLWHDDSGCHDFVGSQYTAVLNDISRYQKSHT